MERTLLILKPDAVARGLVGEITARLEKKGLKLVGCKMAQLPSELLAQHYAHLADKPFYPRIAAFMQSLPVVLQCWEGVDAVTVVRDLVGVTNGRKAQPGTIRGDYSMSIQCNLIHASDGPDAAKAEVARFFEASELFAYQQPLQPFLYSGDEAS
jgi:nucleoside-diphosphate kinase